MGALDVGRVRPPAGRLEVRRVEEAVVEGDETLANAIGNLTEIAGA